MTPEVLILKHVPNEGAGTILDYLKKENIPFRFVELYAGEKLPQSLTGVRAVCVMGGPMNVYEEDKHSFLKDENAFIRKILDARIPCLGVCLGAQLIAKAKGHRVYKAPVAEIGWSDVSLTEEARRDRVFGGAPFPKLRVLQWHEDTFDVPKGGVLLASSKEVPHQAYRLGENAWGLQFHVEADRVMLEDWFKKREDLGKILSEFDSYRTELGRITARMYAGFFGATFTLHLKRE